MIVVYVVLISISAGLVGLALFELFKRKDKTKVKEVNDLKDKIEPNETIF